MKIVLVATGAKGKNVVFVMDTLRAYSLDEAVQLAKDGKIEGVYAVKGKYGAYVRTRPSVPKKEELEALAVSPRRLFRFANGIGSALSHIALNQYLQLYERALKMKERNPFITANAVAGISHREAKEKLQLHRTLIFDAAKMFQIDPYLLGAIIIDELARFAPWEPISDSLLGRYIGVDASAGIAQVTMETARGLIKDGHYNPDANNPRLTSERVGEVSRRELYTYVKEPRHSIFFAAARMRSLINGWKKFVDLTERPEIVATLYHLQYKPPHAHPEENQRGTRIAEEFYRLAQTWLH